MHNHVLMDYVYDIIPFLSNEFKELMYCPMVVKILILAREKDVGTKSSLVENRDCQVGCSLNVVGIKIIQE